ncbi:MAG TPA: hydrogenase expression/formation protein HypE [Aggregatilineales bacterium]|nr:hydrogenase expression/formation protein HypE [Anaerolineales bacterium]HRE48242.1 hydrogenase expression/formation protein HypE [Aggregatilineales bacterium]
MITSPVDLSEFALTCPLPISDYPAVLLAHGGGGKLTHQLIERMFVATFKNTLLDARHDGAVLPPQGGRLAFSTDSYVVKPLFFPGGDIGTLAVTGTVNDLAMCGARPAFLSAAFIIEEGLPMETLWRVVQSMAQTARLAGVQIVTGDTKVVDRGKGDELFITTAGTGIVVGDQVISPRRVQPGDAIVVSGDLGRHGMAIMAAREGLAFESAIESDCAPLTDLVFALLEGGIEVHCLRDLTRGGLASALVEIAEASGWRIHIHEKAIAVREDVRGACEILGLDPLYVANEGRFVAFIAGKDVDRALSLLRRQAAGKDAAIIGEVQPKADHLVTMRSLIGTNRIVDMVSGEQLPRIC